MTKAEIQAQYTQVAMQMGDLQFRIEDQSKLLDTLKQTADSLRRRREELQQQLNAVAKLDAEAEAAPAKGDSDAVEPTAV